MAQWSSVRHASAVLSARQTGMSKMNNRTKDDRPSFRDLIAERHSRRMFLAGAAAGLGAAGAPGFVGSLFSGEAVAQGAASRLGFSELKRVYDKTPRMWRRRLSRRRSWSPGAMRSPAAPSRFEPPKLDAAGQEQRFGYNCDYIAFMPLPQAARRNSDHGLLCVNNEYISPQCHVRRP